MGINLNFHLKEFINFMMSPKFRKAIKYVLLIDLVIIFIAISFKSVNPSIQSFFNHFLIWPLIILVICAVCLLPDWTFRVSVRKLKKLIKKLNIEEMAVLDLFKDRKRPQRFLYNNAVIVNLQRKGILQQLVGHKIEETFLYDLTPRIERIISKINFPFDDKGERNEVLIKNKLNPDYDMEF